MRVRDSLKIFSFLFQSFFHDLYYHDANVSIGNSYVKYSVLIAGCVRKLLIKLPRVSSGW